MAKYRLEMRRPWNPGHIGSTWGGMPVGTPPPDNVLEIEAHDVGIDEKGQWFVFVDDGHAPVAYVAAADVRHIQVVKS